MPSDNEFMIAEAAIQAEMLRRKIDPPEVEDDLPQLAEGYLYDLFAAKPEMKLQRKQTPIRSTFLARLREEQMAKTTTIQNIYIGTNGARDDTETEEETTEEEGAETAAQAETAASVAEGARALALSFEQRMKNIQSAVRKYGILEGCDYWPIATYEDHVVASDWYTGKFYRFNYTMEESEIKLAEPTEVLETFVDMSQAEKSGPFKLFRQRDGKFRWMAISSNTYKDSYKENFSKESLEEAVGAMQKSGDHGELRLEHVLTSRVGVCDFSKVLGDFLVESGTFDTTPVAKKVVETLQGDKDGKWRVSIGFFYNPEYLVDGEYRSHVRIHERSITQIPANTLTAISLAELGGSMENAAETKARLAPLIGEEMAEEIVAAGKDIPALMQSLGRKFNASGFTASGVREKDEDSKDESPPRMIVVDEDGNEMEVIREDLIEEAESGIKRGELREMIRELMREELLPAVQAEIQKQSNSELPREVKYRFTRNGKAASTKAEKDEVKELAETGAGSGAPAGRVAQFWGNYPGGRV